MKICLKVPIRAALVAVCMPLAAQAAATKDIVLDRLAAPGAAVPAPAPGGMRGDAMAVSVLLESADGSLKPKSVSTLFATGDRFRVKLLAARAGKVSLYNTTPSGEFKPAPIWQGEVQPGLETITPRLRLDGQSGVDYLHVVLEPERPPQGVVAWISQWLLKDGGTAAPKDIRLDSEDTPTATYLINQSGQGLVSTIRIVHK